LGPDVVLCEIGLTKLYGYEAGWQMKAQVWDEITILITETGWGRMTTCGSWQGRVSITT